MGASEGGGRQSQTLLPMVSEPDRLLRHGSPIKPLARLQTFSCSPIKLLHVCRPLAANTETLQPSRVRLDRKMKGQKLGALLADVSSSSEHAADKGLAVLGAIKTSLLTT